MVISIECGEYSTFRLFPKNAICVLFIRIKKMTVRVPHIIFGTFRNRFAGLQTAFGNSRNCFAGLQTAFGILRR